MYKCSIQFKLIISVIKSKKDTYKRAQTMRKYHKILKKEVAAGNIPAVSSDINDHAESDHGNEVEKQVLPDNYGFVSESDHNDDDCSDSDSDGDDSRRQSKYAVKKSTPIAQSSCVPKFIFS